MNIKALVIGLIGYIALALALWFSIKQNGRLEVQVQQHKAVAAERQALIEKERMLYAAADLRATHYQSMRGQSDEKLRKLERCIADKSCMPRVRVSCPAAPVPGAPAAAPGTETATAELGEADARAVLQLRRDISLMTDRYLWMQAELVARSDPTYCQPRP